MQLEMNKTLPFKLVTGSENQTCSEMVLKCSEMKINEVQVTFRLKLSRKWVGLSAKDKIVGLRNIIKYSLRQR